MIKFLLAALLLISTTAFAGTPFPPEIGKHIETGKTHTVVAHWDSRHGQSAVGTHGLGVGLPAGALIRQSFMYFVHQFSGSTTVGFKCEDANNIFTSGDITSKTGGQFLAGNETGIAGNMVGAIAADCEISAVVANSVVADGELYLYVDYVITGE